MNLVNTPKANDPVAAPANGAFNKSGEKMFPVHQVLVISVLNVVVFLNVRKGLSTK